MLPRPFELENFLYDPNPRPNLAPLYWALAALGALAAAAIGWALPLARLNRQLRQAKLAAEAAHLAKGRYLAMMTHEVRTPLNGILGFSQLLLDSDLAGEKREQVELIDGAAKSLLALSNDVLDYEKIEAGNIEMEIQPVDAGGLCPGGLPGLFQSAAKAKEISLRLNRRRPARRRRSAPIPTRLRQEVLVNLALQCGEVHPGRRRDRAGDGGGASARRRKPRAPAPAFSEVRDSGIGVPPEQLPRLFLPYSQGDMPRWRAVSAEPALGW